MHRLGLDQDKVKNSQDNAFIASYKSTDYPIFVGDIEIR